MQAKDVGLLAAGAAFTLALLYVAWNESGDQGQPRCEADGNPNLGLVLSALDTGVHYFHPLMCIPGQQVVFTAHKYPSQSGTNATVLINHGLDALRRPAPQDDDWRIRPPGEVMF